MTKYVALLKKAIAHRQNPTASFRRHIYIKARLAIDMKLLEVEAAEPVVKQHRAMLEKAIMDIETYYISETIMSELKKSGAIAPLDKSFADVEDELDIEDNFDQLDAVAERHIKTNHPTLSSPATHANPVHQRVRDEMDGLPKANFGQQKNTAEVVSHSQQNSSDSTPAIRAESFVKPVSATPDKSMRNGSKDESGEQFSAALQQLKMQTSRRFENTVEVAAQKNVQQSEVKAQPQSLSSVNRPLNEKTGHTVEKTQIERNEILQTNPDGAYQEQKPKRPVEDFSIDSDSAIPNFSLQTDNMYAAFGAPSAYRSNPYPQNLNRNREDSRSAQSEVKKTEEQPPVAEDTEDREPSPFDQIASLDALPAEEKTRGSDEGALPEFLKQPHSDVKQASNKEEGSKLNPQTVRIEIQNEVNETAERFPAESIDNQCYPANDDRRPNKEAQTEQTISVATNADNRHGRQRLRDDKKVRSFFNIEKIAYVVNGTIILFLCIVAYFIFSMLFGTDQRDTPATKIADNAIQTTDGKKPLQPSDVAKGKVITSKSDFRLLADGSEVSAQQTHIARDDAFMNKTSEPRKSESKTEFEKTSATDDLNALLSDDTPYTSSLTEAASATTANAEQTTDTAKSAAPALSTAMLYDWGADKKWHKLASAQVNWSVLPLTTNAAGIREYAAKSDTLFAGQSLVAGIIIKRNHDKNLNATYMMELRFKYTGSDREKVIADIEHIDLETSDKASKQNFIISKFDDNYFGAALLIDNVQVNSIDELMQQFQGINIIMQRSDGQKYFIYIDKGETGNNALQKVIAIR
ncbi:hypothetical protein [Bartonella sp. LJL80]